MWTKIQNAYVQIPDKRQTNKHLFLENLKKKWNYIYEQPVIRVERDRGATNGGERGRSPLLFLKIEKKVPQF